MNDYKTIDKRHWTCLNKEGDAGSGLIYTNPEEPDVILRTSRRPQESARDNIVKEFYTAKAVYDLGVPTPKVVEIVKIDDQYGIKSQYIKSKEDLIAFVEGLEDAPTLLHGKFNFTNLIEEDGKPYWIDLERAAHGLPMFDLGQFYLYCHYFSKQDRVNNIAHMSEEQIQLFWNRFAFHYNGPDSLEQFDALCKRYAGLALIMIGYIQVLTDHERGYLGKLAAYLLQ